MNCLNHPETGAAAYCRECGKPMCGECQRPALGSVYCVEHVPVAAPQAPPPMPYAQSPYSAPVMPNPGEPHASPALALILGFIPGVGAIYNGQYAKGLIHAVVFGLLVSIMSSGRLGGSEPLLGIMLAAWVFYQAFEAYHTARKRRYGLVVDEFSSLFEPGSGGSKFPVGAVFLILIGFVFLLDTTDIVSFDDVARYWPVLLIGAGGYMLFNRLKPREQGTEQGDVP